MEAIRPFNWMAAIAEINTGFQPGPQFKNPNLSPPMYIVDGTAPGVDEKLMVQDASEEAIIDSWNVRRQK